MFISLSREKCIEFTALLVIYFLRKTKFAIFNPQSNNSLILPRKMRYKIQTWVNNPILRSKSLEVETIDDELQLFFLALRKMMYTNDGVGLAAPQIGQNIRVIATTQREKKSGKSKLIGETIMVNPVITDMSKEMITAEEACLSVPDVFGFVRRHKSVTVQFLDHKGHKQNWRISTRQLSNTK